MKACALTILIAFSTIGLADSPAHEEDRSDSWVPPQAAYGQLKLLPSAVIPHFASAKDWYGPWKLCNAFSVVITFSEGQQMSPEQFSFVTPMVRIEGLFDKGRERSGRAAPMFRRESSKQDVAIHFEKPPSEIELERDYVAARLSSPKAETEWTVWIRFTETEPEYIRQAETPQEQGK